MKKVRIVITALLVLCLSALIFAGCGEKETKKSSGKKTYTIGIMTDPQIVAESDVGDDDYESFKSLDSVGQKMLFISEAILKTAVDRFIEEKVDCVIVPGDVTENGSKVGHQTMARELQRLEDAGIPAYVMCGNHDVNKDPYRCTASGKVDCDGVTPEEFRSIYKNFGFDDEDEGFIARDDLDNPVQTTVTVDGKSKTFTEVGTMSYVYDLTGSNYRLISFDATNYYEDENEDCYYVNEKGEIPGTGCAVSTERSLAWLKNQLDKCEEDGKEPLIMCHFPILDQMGSFVGQFDVDDNTINRQEDVQEIVANSTVKYVFTGHLHTQHETAYYNEDGEIEFIDIETGSLSNYANPIRYFITDKKGNVTLKNEYIEKVTAEYIPSYVSEEIKAQVTTDLPSYALRFIYYNLLNNFDNQINDDGEYSLFYSIFDMMGFDCDSEKVQQLAADIYDLYDGFMKMPLYKAEAKAGEVSLESICEKYGVTLPESSYHDDVFDFVCHIIGIVYKNSGGLDGKSVEATILKYGVYSVFDRLADFDLFGRLNEIDSSIAKISFDELTERLFEEGVLDLTSDDLISKALSLLNPILEANADKLPSVIAGADFSDMDTESILSLLSLVNVSGAVEQFMPGIASGKAKTIAGIPESELFNLGEGEIYMDAIFDKLVFGVIGEGLLYYTEPLFE